MAFWLLVLAFIAERAHQWQSLLSRDWTVRFNGAAVSRRLILGTALAIGWGEGLGFFVESEPAFWGLIFWAYAAHVIITASLWLRRSSSVLRIIGPVVVAAATVLAMLPIGTLEKSRPTAWFGQSLVSPFPGEAPAWWCLVFLIGAHAIPCFVLNVQRSSPKTRVRTAAVAVFLAGVEWFIVAKSVWFASGSSFPDLVDWWDLGPHADFLLHPIWMAPFLAHVAIDAIRYFQPPTETAA